MAYVVGRLLWMVPTLLGITLVTFLALEWAPLDRAQVQVQQLEHEDRAARAAALEALEREHGLIDPTTGERVSVWRRYGRWLARLARLDLHGPGEDPKEFRRRLRQALPVTVLVNFWAILLALLVAGRLGPAAGAAPGSVLDRGANGVMFALYGIPDFVLATLLVVGLSGLGWFPARGLHSDGAESLGVWLRIADTAWHLVLPVLTLAVGPAVVLTRFVREGVRHAMRSDFVLNLRAWGAPPVQVRRVVRRAAWAPVLTLAGALIPMLVGGSVVVESVFGLPGMGQLAWQALMLRDIGMVMTLTVLGAVLTLVGLLVSDLLHRGRDRRVEWRGDPLVPAAGGQR